MLPDYRVRQRDYLLEIAQAITQELDLDALLKHILRLSAEILAGQAGLIAPYSIPNCMIAPAHKWHGMVVIYIVAPA